MRRARAGWATLAKRLDEKPQQIRAFYLSVAPSLFARDRPAAGARPAIATPDSRIVVEKPLGHDLASAQGAQRRAAQALRRGADLPDRPLPREGDGAEPDGDPLRQRALRAALELALRRAGADHRRRVDRRRRARRLLRQVGRDAGHGAEPHDAAPLPDRDGAAVEVRSRRRARREAQGDPRARPAEARRHGARPVPRRRRRRQLSRSRRQPGQPHRELRRHPGAHRQLALVGNAVLSPDRQEAVVADVGDLRGLQASAAHDLPAGRGAARQCADHPAAAERGHHAARRDQGSGTRRDAAGRGAARHDLREHARTRRRDARGLRAADHGRDPRQPDALHARRRGRGGLGVGRPDRRRPGRRAARGRCPTTRAAPGRSTPTS